MPPSVLFTISPIGGGAEIFVELCAGLRARGWRTALLVPDWCRAHEVDTGVPMHYYDVPPETFMGGDGFCLESQLRYGLATYRALRALETDFDAVFAHLPWGMCTLYAQRRRRPLVGFLDTSVWHIVHADLKEPLAPETAEAVSIGIEKHVHDRVFRACDRLVAPSAFFRDIHLARAGPVPIETIPHGRDGSRYRPHPDRAAVRAALGLPVEGTIVLHAGHNFRYKGLELFADLALRVNDPGVHFVIVGPQVDAFARWFERDPTMAPRHGTRFHIRPTVANQDMPSYFAAADIFVSTTRYESFGLAPAEALATGLPVVTHRVCSLPELVDDGVEGWLVPVGDLDLLELRTRQLIGDRGLRETMGRAARARFERDFTIGRAIDRYEAIFRAVAR